MKITYCAIYYLLVGSICAALATVLRAI